MRARLAQDYARNVPFKKAGTVRLQGLAGLSEFVGQAAPELAGQRHAVRDQSGGVFTEAPA